MTQRVGNLDAVRACAILMVLVYHSVQMATGSAGAASVGEFGVDLFFALSGFLIGGLYWRERQQRGSVDPLRFIARRALRTVPPYLGGLAIGYLAVRFYRGDAFDWRYLTFTQNYEPKLPFFSVSWSLCIEEQFYLALPLILFLTPRRLLAVVPLVAVAASFAARWRLVATGGPTDLLPFGYPTFVTHLRLEGLAFGVLAAYLATYRPHWIARLRHVRALVLTFVVWALYFILRVEPVYAYVGGLTVLAGIFAAWVSLAAVDRPWRVAQWPGTRLVAVTSYSVYLTHATVLQVVLRAGQRLSLPGAVTCALMIASALAVGYGFYRLVEQPAIMLRDWLVPHRPRDHAVASVSTAIS